MLFLISKKQKDKILDEYYSYLLNIISTSLFILLIIFIISFFPTYLIMKVDRQILTDKLSTLQNETDNNKSQNEDKDSLSINNDISILSSDLKNKNTIDLYYEIMEIYKSVPNIKILSVNVDSLSKKVSVTADVDNKNTANILVDKLNTTRFKGADLPYSVFNQNKNFIFNQNLSYE